MACITGAMLTMGAAPVCLPGTETAVAAAGSTSWLIPALFIFAVMYFESQKGESEWPIDVDVMEDGE